MTVVTNCFLLSSVDPSNGQGGPGALLTVHGERDLRLPGAVLTVHGERDLLLPGAVLTVHGERDLLLPGTHSRHHGTAHVLPSILLPHRLERQDVVVAQDLPEGILWVIERPAQGHLHIQDSRGALKALKGSAPQLLKSNFWGPCPEDTESSFALGGC